MQITKEDLEKYKKNFLDLSDDFAIYFSRKYSIKDMDEIKSKALEIFTTKCGDTIYNLESKS